MTDYKGKSCRFCSSQGIGFEIENVRTMLGKLIDKIEDQTKEAGNNNTFSGYAMFRHAFELDKSGSKLTVIGGHPSSMHFVLAERLLADSLDNGAVCSVIGTESGNIGVLHRYVSQYTNINDIKMMTGALSGSEWKTLGTGIKDIESQKSLFFISNKSLTVDSVVSAVETLKLQNSDLSMILISCDDFVHFCESKCSPSNSSCLGGALRYLVDTLKISIIVTTNIKENNHSNDKPNLRDFSGEQNLTDYADVLALCEPVNIGRTNQCKESRRLEVFVRGSRKLHRLTFAVDEYGVPGLEIGNF